MSIGRFEMGYRRRLLIKRIVLTLFFVGLVVALATLYVALRVGSDLSAARTALGAAPTRLPPQQLVLARQKLDDAQSTLGSFPASVLRYIPVLGANLDAVHATAQAASPVLGAGLALRTSLEQSLNGGVVNDKTINIGALHDLREPLHLQLQSLEALHRAVNDHLSGLLVPALYSRLHELDTQVAGYQAAASGADTLLRQVPDMVGAHGKRTYLVTFLNNSELRGAGGIMSGVGTIGFSHGQITLGKFRYYQDIRRLAPRVTVKTPADYHRRFARYNAGTARWVNTSASPQVPEVALVAARLYKAATGVRTDGVIVVDPRGIQALLPPTNVLTIAGGQHVPTEKLPSFVYSGAYRNHGPSTQRQRREALIAVGRAAFDRASSHAIGELGGITRIGNAISAGHLRFVSFHPDEERALQAAGTTGRITPGPSDSVMVNVQNFGGDKLDYWADRSIVHRCGINPDGSALCETVVRITNKAPEGLPEYVLNARPEPNMISEVDVYIPGRATLKAVTTDGKPARYFAEKDFGRRSIGTYLHIAPRSSQEMRVLYSLPAGDSRFSLEVTPQPLARDASLKVELGVPRAWDEAAGPGLLRGGIYRYTAPLTGPVSLSLGPSREPGLSNIWNHLVHFWNNPI